MRKLDTAGVRWWILPLVLASVHAILLAIPARQHVIGNYENETDFYQYSAPDAERIADGRFPESPFHGPGYAMVVALASTVTGDAHTSGVWISVASAVLVGLLAFLLLARLFGYWVGVAAQLLLPVFSVMPVVSISAMSDLPFLALCLAALVVITGGRTAPLARAVAAGALAGAAYLVRYNGIFLVIACPLGIAALDLFDRPVGQRLRIAAVCIAASTLVTLPWLYANYAHRGSPFYNHHYQNVALVFYEGHLSQDGTRAMATRFGSLRDVIMEDPLRIAVRYPANVYSHLTNSLSVLVTAPMALVTALGLILAMLRLRSRPVFFVIGTGALYMLMMGLAHWETRYFLFPLVIYVGLACYALAFFVETAVERGWCSRPTGATAAAVITALLWTSLVIEGRARVAGVLRSQPVELFEARDFLRETGSSGRRILARKPHLAYLSGSTWVFLPELASVDELCHWVGANPVDFLLFGPVEVARRPGLGSLRDPWNAPSCLRPVWASESGSHVLYATVAHADAIEGHTPSYPRSSR